MLGIHLGKKIKDIQYLDLYLIKLGVVFLVFFILLAVPYLMGWLNKQNPWWMLAIAVLFLARPIYNHYLK